MIITAKFHKDKRLEKEMFNSTTQCITKHVDFLVARSPPAPIEKKFSCFFEAISTKKP